MKQPALILVKPDGLMKGLVGSIISRFEKEDMALIAARVVDVSRELAEDHYHHLCDKPFYQEVIEYLVGDYHNGHNVVAMVFYGENAIKKCRAIAGATNPEEADPKSIRGSLGRITTAGVFENVVHVSSDEKEAVREIKLWFSPEEITISVKGLKSGVNKAAQQKVWI
jgi:nucleoside-diphosphate kinase